MGEGGGQAGPVDTGSGGTVLEHAMAAELREGVALEVELLVLGRDAGVADQHAGGGT